ncbi:oligosaccharide flippase family protein [Patescibacteria group bacterium]|nr:oligosaccharide flippase family protein [Patescibacteria group bacterium]MBU1613498.1 oligosaccharide flippase family protein [Patescibacteria group bacterium]
MKFIIIKEKIKQMLIWSQKYTKTDMLYLAKGGFWLSASNISSAIASLILLYLFANYLGKEIYGTYKFALSIFGLLSIFNLNGINTATTRAVAAHNNAVVLPALKTKIKMGVIGALVSLAISLYYYINNNYQLSLIFLIMSFFLPIFDSFNIYSSILIGRKKFNKTALYLIASQIVATTTISFSIFTRNIFIILATYLSSWMLLRMYFFNKTIREIDVKSIDKKTDLDIKFGKHLSVIGVIDTISGQVDKMLIFHFLGPIELAAYSLAIAPVDQIKSLISNIQNLILPKYSNKSLNDIQIGLKSKKWILVVTLLFIILFYILCAPFLYRTIFPAYMESVIFSQLFAVSLFSVPALFFVTAFKSKTMAGELYKLKISTLVMQIILYSAVSFHPTVLNFIIIRILIRFFNMALSGSILFKK